jgi:hypothetical protein
MSSTNAQHEPASRNGAPVELLRHKPGKHLIGSHPNDLTFEMFTKWLPLRHEVQADPAKAHERVHRCLVKSNETTFIFYVHLLLLLLGSDVTLFCFITASLSSFSISRRSSSPASFPRAARAVIGSASPVMETVLNDKKNQIR